MLHPVQILRVWGLGQKERLLKESINNLNGHTVFSRPGIGGSKPNEHALRTVAIFTAPEFSDMKIAHKLFNGDTTRVSAA